MSAAADVELLEQWHDDARRCAEQAGLVYVEGEPAGITRRRRGRGFSYADHRRRPVRDEATLTRIAELAIPPAWREVWICPDPDGHLLATGIDAAGRKQYLYHPRWREQRDQINFYRLIIVARALPTLRRHLSTQLRRRTPDRERVLAGMIALLDSSLIRVGNEVYAEENDSIGLCTLERSHVAVSARQAVLTFPAKSGTQASVTVRDAGLLRLIRDLGRLDGERVFKIDGHPVSTDEVNAALADITGERVTAKDVRTWGGTVAAFSVLLPYAKRGPAADDVLLAAVDAAAEALGNTRAIARAHYVHPDVLSCFAEGSAAALLARAKPPRQSLLSPAERKLTGLLDVLFADHVGNGTDQEWAEMGR